MRSCASRNKNAFPELMVYCWVLQLITAAFFFGGMQADGGREKYPVSLDFVAFLAFVKLKGVVTEE